MKRRPTIPFFEWRIAVHLERTREIQNQAGMPAYRCQCELCKTWKHSYLEIIPSEIIGELRRLGVQLDAPSELYGHPPNQGKRHVRAIYHVVGKILSGPESVVFHNGLDEHMQNYVTIREEPWFRVRVLDANESFEPSPSIENSNDGDVIALDFRFEMCNE